MPSAPDARSDARSDALATPLARVASLWVFPVKSLRGSAVPEAALLRDGLAYDRRWMLVRPDGAMLTQRAVPAMSTVRAVVDAPRGALVLERTEENRAPSALARRLELPLEHATNEGPEREATVWDDTLRARSVGHGADAWLRAALGVECALVRLDERVERAVDPKYAQASDRVAFADGFPLLVTCEASLAALNETLATPVSIERFRGNVVLAGTRPWDEERWRLVRVGAAPGVLVRTVKPCTRCAVVNVDPETGATSPETLRALTALRKSAGAAKVTFGQNALHDATAARLDGSAPWLRVGEPVTVLERDDDAARQPA